MKPPGRPDREDDLAAALRFLHLVDAETKARVAELAVEVAALREALVARGAVDADDLAGRRRLAILDENRRHAREAHVELDPTPDKYALDALPEIDCASLLPLCRARCCAMPFALSVQDLDEGVVRWRYAAPYVVATGPDGACVHLDGGACAVHARRPARCRLYDCRRDRRVWLDFDRRIPAP